jgi:hypothetical protein
MPQAVQSIFVTMTVTNNPSQKQNLIKLVNQSDNPAAIELSPNLGDERGQAAAI